MRKSRTAAFLLIFALCFAFLQPVLPVAAGTIPVWDGSIATAFASGSGTAADPFLIETGAQLAFLAQRVTAGTSYTGKFFRLANDIFLNNLSDFEAWSAEAGPANCWTPIGKYSKTFNGTFDGDGHTVFGMYIPSGSYTGLFSFTGTRSTVKNLHLRYAKVFGNGSFASLISTCYGTVDGCTSDAVVVGSGNNVGGLISFLSGNTNVTATVKNCSFSGTVTSTGNECGGVIAQSVTNYDTATLRIENCKNSGQITGTGMRYGGVVGNCRDTVVVNCRNTGTVRAENWCAGGVCGFLYSRYIGASLSNCRNSGSVYATFWVGGVVGETHAAYGLSNLVENSFNTGDVSGDECVGGVVGNSCVTEQSTSTVRRVCNTGTVTGNKNVGGVLGILGPNTNVTVADAPQTMLFFSDSFNIGPVQGDSAVGGVLGMMNETRSEATALYSVGSVKGTSSVGAVAGEIDGTAADMFALEGGDLAAVGTVGAEASLTNVRLLSAETMRTEEPYGAFDLQGIFTLDGDGAYPYPRLRALLGYTENGVCPHACYDKTTAMPDCGHAGAMLRVCLLCGDESESEIPPSGPHTPGSYTRALNPSGVMCCVQTCSVCNTTLSTRPLGDSDGNGTFDAADAIVLERWLAGWASATAPQTELCDIDGDGVLTDWDAILMTRQLAGWEISAFTGN